MIEILEYNSVTDNFGDCYGLKPPSTRQIVDKINEIIDYINSKEMIFKVKRSSDLFEDEESKETTEINTLEEL